jgi:hypothetical protein
MATNTNFVKIGDTVMWRGNFGTSEPKEAKVVGLQVSRSERVKYGRIAKKASWTKVRENKVVFDLDNGHWAYGEQIFPA